jgi:hypothetical protein
MKKSKKLLALLLTALLVVSLLPTVALADETPNTIEVDGSTKTLAAAISEANAGDTIKLLAGRHTAPSDFITKRVNLVGAGADKTTIVGPLTYMFSEDQESKTLSVSGLTFEATDTDNTTGLLFRGDKPNNGYNLDISVEDCAFDGWLYGVGVYSHANGYNLTVEGCTFNTWCGVCFNQDKETVGQIADNTLTFAGKNTIGSYAVQLFDNKSPNEVNKYYETVEMYASEEGESVAAENVVGTYFVSSATQLSTALNKAASGATITLLGDIDIKNKISIGKDLTLDLNGFTIAPDVTAAAFAGDSVMKNGSSGAVPLIEVTAGNVTVKNGTMQNKKYARYVIGDSAGATLTLEDMTLIKKEHSNRGNDVVQINGALKVVGTLDIKVAPCTLYWNSNGVNVQDGFVQKIWGGISFNSSANPTTCSIDFSKCTRFTITDDAEEDGGTLTQAPIHLVSMADFDHVTDWENVEGLVKVIGDSMPMTGFAFADSAFLKANYPVKIGDVYYQSIDKAIECAESTDVIELVKDVTIANPVNVTKAVSIDGKGFTLTLSSGDAIFNAKNNVNNDGISESLTVKNLNMVMNSEAPAQSGYAVIAGRGAEGFAISFDSCSFQNMWCGAMLNGCGTGTVAPDVTIKNSTFENVAHGVSFAVADYAGTVTFTGNKMSGETDIQEVFTTDGYVKTPTVKVTDGYYTADPTAYLASGYAVAGSDVQGYAYMVTEVDLPAGGNEKIAVTFEEPKVAENSITGIDENTQNAIKAAAVKTEVAGLGQDALKEAAKVNAESAKAKLIEASVEVGNDANVTVFAQTYLDVKPTAYSAEDATKVYTVDIKPMVQLIATTAAEADDIITDTEDKNAVALGDPAELKVNTPVVVTIPLPTGFATEGNILFVKHTKDNGTSYLYKCTVQKTGEQLYIQFVNNNGFSTFEITTVDTSVASIVKGGSTLYYMSLSAAVAAVKDGETIELTANCGETVTVAREVSFTLDKNGKTFSGSITPGANYKNTGSASEGTISYVFTYVAPSGGGGAASYTVSTATATHGKVTVDKTSASAGDTVTITVAPEKGFTLETLTVKDAKGNEVALTAVKTGETYTFKMPAGKVTVSATFMEDNTMLNFFVDVPATEYYYDAVLWAAKNGITLGVDDTHFAPMAIATRGQMVTFLWRAAGSPEPTATTCAFTDVKADEYYYKAVLWAVETGITKGTSDTTFSPDENVSRSQTVTFLARMSGVKDDATGYSHNFADVKTTDYYNNAVAWAATNKITVGTSATTFSPNDDCLRGQIVTFLYRNFVK